MKCEVSGMPRSSPEADPGEQRARSDLPRALARPWVAVRARVRIAAHCMQGRTCAHAQKWLEPRGMRAAQSTCCGRGRRFELEEEPIAPPAKRDGLSWSAKGFDRSVQIGIFAAGCRRTGNGRG